MHSAEAELAQREVGQEYLLLVPCIKKDLLLTI